MKLARVIASVLPVLLFASALSAQGLSPVVALPTHENEDSYRPGAAFGADSFLVVWQSNRRMKGNLVGCRVGRDGKPVDGKPFVVCDAEMDQERPRVAFGRDVFLVVWQDIRGKGDYDTYAARVTVDGRVLDEDGFLVAGGKHNQCNPRVAYDGKTFVVVYEDFRNGKNYQVYAARVSLDGKVLDAGGIQVASDKSYHRLNPDIASAGDGRSMVIWLGHLVNGRGEMAGGAFLREGKADGTFKIDRIKDRSLGDRANHVAVAAGLDGYCAVWKNGPGARGGSSNKANCAVLDKAGKMGERVFVPGAGTIYDPDVTWDGSAYVTAYRLQDGYEQSCRKHGSYDHAAAGRIGPDGTPMGKRLDAGGVYESPAASACVASDGKGATLIGFEQHPKTGDVPITIHVRMLHWTF